jgi:hypothetical protein
MKSILSLITLFVCMTNSFSQNITNVEATQFGNNIEVAYTVSGATANEPYAIQVSYTSKSGATSPMTHVYGDVGKSIAGNGSKKIIWDVLREIDAFEGDYAFKVVLLPAKGGRTPIVNKVENSNDEAEEGRVGKFKAEIINTSITDTSVTVKFTLLNTKDNENYKVHVTRSKIIGPDGTAYLAKSGNQGSKDQYGFMNVVLNKGVEKEVSLLFDYVPEDISFLKTIEIVRYMGMITSESIVITNINISK